MSIDHNTCAEAALVAIARHPSFPFIFGLYAVIQNASKVLRAEVLGSRARDCKLLSGTALHLVRTKWIMVSLDYITEPKLRQSS